MRRSLIALPTTTAVLLFGGTPLVAQQGPGGRMMQGAPQEMQQRREMIQQQRQQQLQQAPETGDQDSTRSDSYYDRGMMGRGYHRGWMHDPRRGHQQRRMRDSDWGPGGMMGPSMMGLGMMRMLFILMDTDGDGSLSLEEFQATHERISKAMDANKDGRVTLEEMQAFRMNPPAEQQ